jgi:hypothetical protein
MSMNGRFREITPGLLSQMHDDPSLVEAAILGSFLEGSSDSASVVTGDPELDSLFASFPARQREQLKAAVETMTPDARARMLEQLKLSAATLRGLAESTRAGSASGSAAIDPAQLGEQLDIQKAWHGLHFLLAGSIDLTPELPARAILGGTEIGEDTGYGPPRYHDAKAVVAIADALSSISPEAFGKRYDADALNAADVYPGGWEDEENRDWLIDAYTDVLAFYRGVAARGNAALLYLI